MALVNRKSTGLWWPPVTRVLHVPGESGCEREAQQVPRSFSDPSIWLIQKVGGCEQQEGGAGVAPESAPEERAQGPDTQEVRGTNCAPPTKEAGTAKVH